MANSATLAYSYGHTWRRRGRIYAQRPGVTPATITGTPGTGNIFTMNPGTWAPATATLIEYQWFRGKNEIVGQTAVTYTQQPQDASVTLRCAMVVTDPLLGILVRSVRAPLAP